MTVLSRLGVALGLVSSVALAPVALVAASVATAPAAHAETASKAAQARLRKLVKSPQFAKARASLEADWDTIVADVVTLTEIEAPPFGEAMRAAAFAEMLKEVGLTDVFVDEEGNAQGIRKGTSGDGTLLVVAAHLDTVFPAGTNVTVRREGDKLFAPGIGDDTCSLAVLLAFVRALDRAGVKTKQDILFMGNVGEEGPGDLRGVRYLFTKSRYKDRITQFISFEPGRDRIATGGVGSKRYRVAFKGPGGHSYGAFGLVNPAYAMADAMTQFAAMPVVKDPKTTFSIGIVEGGTSVNSIPFETAMTIDLRSEGKEPLEREVKYLMDILPGAVARENAARSTAEGEISVEVEQIGDRPVGSTDPASEIVQVATAASNVLGGDPAYRSGSTDSNMPMSLGIPAVTLASGFETERAHSLDEALLLDKDGTLAAMAPGLATIIALAGGD